MARTLYFALLPSDIIKYFHREYLAKDLDIMWKELWPKIIYNLDTSPFWLVTYSARHGYVKILEYAMKKGYKTDHVLEIAVNHGRLGVLQWLKELQPFASLSTWSSSCCSTAAGNGDLEMLEWLVRYGCHATEACIVMAATNGHVHILDWIKKKSPIYWDNGDELDIKWLERDWNILSVCTERGHLNVLKWLKANNIYDRNLIAVTASTNNRHEILEWLQSNTLKDNDYETKSYLAFHPELNTLTKKNKDR